MTSKDSAQCPSSNSTRDSAGPGGHLSSPLPNQNSPSGRESGFGRLPAILIGLAVAGAAAALFLVLSNSSSPPPTAKPEVVEKVDLEGTRAKAERGDAEAQKNLGRIFAKGDLVKQDYKEAAKWYRQAAEQGHAGAQAALGQLYEAGQGVARDYDEAAKWYRKAADQGNVTGQYCLAVLYVVGKGVPQSNADAVKWYQQAAEQGDELAQYNLGMRYYEGSGVAADPVAAYQWLSLAAKRGVQDAASPLSEVKRKMTSEQVAEGRRRVEAFVIKPSPPPAK